MKIDHQVDIKPFTTFGISEPVQDFVSLDHVNELIAFLNTESLNEKKHLILGGGSNLLFVKPFDGLVISPKIMGIEMTTESENKVVVCAGAGEVWDDFVKYCVDNKFWGIENLSLIPGTVGAAPVQNIGAYGVEAQDAIFSVEAVNRFDGTIKTFEKADCQFGYRDSIFKQTEAWIVTRVFFELSKIAHPQLSYEPLKQCFTNLIDVRIEEIRQAVIQIRQSKLPDPKEVGNAGSFFKNPVIDLHDFNRLQAEYPNMPLHLVDIDKAKIPAAWLIDQAGWKGYRKGEAGVHPNQALVLINYGAAKGHDILELSKSIEQSVLDKFGIVLEREVIVVS